MKHLYIIFFIAIVMTEEVVYSNICEKNQTITNKKIIVHSKNISMTSEYITDWNSLDRRPLPKWYDNVKIGVLLHWGLYSVPAYSSESLWHDWTEGNSVNDFIKNNYKPRFTYQGFGPMFRADLYIPHHWVDILEKSGAKYVILTSKHQDGYTLFPSHWSFSWNSMDLGPKKDLVKELAKKVKEKGLIFGLYYSLGEWYNPVYLEDKANGFKTQNYIDYKVMPELKQIVNDYKPSIIWSDGDLEANAHYWKSKEFLAWLYNESPVKDEVAVNDRWGNGTWCRHGGFFDCGNHFHPGKKVPKKWENTFSLDRLSKGYRNNMKLEDILSFQELLEEVVSTISSGGNALINIGITKEGTIIPIFEERLLSLGEWLERNGEAIYGTTPWKHHKDSFSKKTKVWYTCVKDPKLQDNLNKDNTRAIYVIILEKIKMDTVTLRDIASINSNTHNIQILGEPDLTLRWRRNCNDAQITFLSSYPEYPVLKITRKHSEEKKTQK